MGWLEATVRLLEAAIWPLVVVILGVLYKQPLIDLIARTKSAEAPGGFKATFAEALGQADAALDAATEPSTRIPEAAQEEVLLTDTAEEILDQLYPPDPSGNLKALVTREASKWRHPSRASITMDLIGDRTPHELLEEWPLAGNNFLALRRLPSRRDAVKAAVGTTERDIYAVGRFFRVPDRSPAAILGAVGTIGAMEAWGHLSDAWLAIDFSCEELASMPRGDAAAEVEAGRLLDVLERFENSFHALVTAFYEAILGWITTTPEGDEIFQPPILTD